jgi:plasmid stabilization system protein ParE
MSGFVLHPAAYADLDEIWEYIAADNLSAADGVLEEIYQAIGALVPFPQVGHSRHDLTSKPLRFQPVRDFLIAYAPDEKPLLVIGILHGKRNPRVIAAILRERD